MTFAALSLPHFLILGWMAGGVIALWIAHRLGVTGKNQINILLPMALGLVVFTLYMNTRDNYEFMIDDVDIVQTHPDVSSASGWKTLWGHDYWANRSVDDNLYRPVTILSYWVNARLPLGGKIVDGEAVEVYPRYFRGVNMVLLAGLGWILALWLRTYVQQTAAWLAAFLFVAHPSHAVLINYVVGRADLLAMIGIVGFLYMHRLSVMGMRWRWWMGLIAVACTVIAFGSKETGVILLPAVCFQSWMGKRNADSEVTDFVPPTSTRSRIATASLILLPLTMYMIARFVVVGVGVSYASNAVFLDDMRDNPLVTMSFFERLPAAFSIAWFYATQVILPDTSFYQIPAELPTWTSATTIMGITTLVTGTMLLLGAIHKRQWLAIGLVVAFGQFLLVGNFTMPVGVYAANRLMLPFTFCGAVLAAHFFHGFCLQSTRRRAVAIIPAIVVVLYMVPVIQEVNYYWGSEARLTGRDKRRDPSNPIAQYNFATTRAIEGRSAQLRAGVIKYAINMIDRIASIKDTDPISKRVELTKDLNRLREMMQAQGGIAVVPRHPELFKALKGTPRRLDLAIGQLPHLLDQRAVLEELKVDLHVELKESRQNAQRFLAEASGLLVYVVKQRPHSINAHMQLAKTYEYLALPGFAQKEYLAVANMEGHDRNLNVLEAKVQFGWLGMSPPLQIRLAAEHLKEAEATLGMMLAEQKPMRPEVESRVHELNKNAKRYLSLLAFAVGDVPSALKRNRELLKLYPDFKAAREDIPRFIQARDGKSPPNG